MYNKIIEKVKEFDTIIIHRHSRPDGDALGGQVGLKEILKLNFPSKSIYAVGDSSNRYGFIGEMDVIEDCVYENALVFVLDSSEKHLISDERYELGKFLIKVDHHLKREEYGDIEVIDESFESCCGLITDIIVSTGLKMNKSGAEALYTGMVTDSGRFRFDSTSSKTFMMASKLLENQIDLNAIYNNLYIDELDTVLLRAKSVLKMQFTKNNVAYIKTTDEEIKSYGTDVFTASRGMVNVMAGIRNIDIWANFTEDKANNGIIVELRSSKYNINPIAVKYGGGGHAKASGATVESFEVVEQILKDLDDLASKGE